MSLLTAKQIRQRGRVFDELRQVTQGKRRLLDRLASRRDEISALRSKPLPNLDMADVIAINNSQGMVINNPEELRGLMAAVDNLQIQVNDLPDQTLNLQTDIEDYREGMLPSSLQKEYLQSFTDIFTDSRNTRKRRIQKKREDQRKPLNKLLGEVVVGQHLIRERELNALEELALQEREMELNALRELALTRQEELYRRTVALMGDEIDRGDIVMTSLAHGPSDTNVMLYDLLESISNRSQTPGAIYIEAPAGLRLHESPAKAVGAWLQDSGGAFSAGLSKVLVEAENRGWEIVPVDATSANLDERAPDEEVLKNSGVLLHDNEDLVGGPLQANIPRQNYIARNMHAYATNSNRGGILLMGYKHYLNIKGGRLRNMLTNRPLGGYDESLLLHTKGASGRVYLVKKLDLRQVRPSYQDEQGDLQ